MCTPYICSAILALTVTHLSIVSAVPSIIYIGPQSSEGRASISDGVLVVEQDVDTAVNVYGQYLTDGQLVTFTTVTGDVGSKCGLGVFKEAFSLSTVKSIRTNEGIVVADMQLLLDALPDDSEFFYVCLSVTVSRSDTSNASFSTANTTTAPSSSSQAPQFDDTRMDWIHQGIAVKVKSKPRFMPLWVQITCIIVFLSLSSCFSGLTLGLMSLDPTELQIIQNAGSEHERKYAKIIAPIRKRGNFLLCTLLLGNVLVNSTFTWMLDDLGGGITAIIGSTVGIVIFGEIVPQAICSRHGLAVGAKTVWLTKTFMVLTFPISFPLSRLLDCIMGAEIGQVYNREKLAELIKLGADTHDIKNQELNIIHGALQLTKKTTADVMTPLDDVYMLESNAILNFELMSEILHTGYTRVPVYENDRLNIVALLNIKDLAFVDPDDKIPLKTVCKFYNHPINFVFDDTRLDALLEEFKKGQSHLAFVQKIVTDGKSDPYYQVLGIVTLEDIIEEIIQSEILDESDIVTDNRTKLRRHNMRRKNFLDFAQPEDASGRPLMSPQLTLAAFQYLQSAVEPFKEEFISGNMLKRLLKKEIFVRYTHDQKSIDTLLYIAGKPADYFIIILQGRCTVEIGRDSMKFEAGPFFYFGAEALMIGDPKRCLGSKSAADLNYLLLSRTRTYEPDFSVRAETDLDYLKIRRHEYVAAVRATLMERMATPLPPGDNNQLATREHDDQFAVEWKRAGKLQSHLSDEGLKEPIRIPRQRNYSFGNVDDIRGHAIDIHSLKSSPMTRNTQQGVQGPTRNIICHNLDYTSNQEPGLNDSESDSLLQNPQIVVMSINSD